MNQATQNKVVRIGGASGFWGDSSLGAPQLVRSGQIDYLVFDYLAELTMSILAGARLKKPELGYATDFVSVAMKQVLKDVVDQGIRVVSNAGGVNPQGCAAALQALAVDMGLSICYLRALVSKGFLRAAKTIVRSPPRPLPPAKRAAPSRPSFATTGAPRRASCFSASSMPRLQPS